MRVKNYYLILGVPRTASAAGIRAAYRNLAKKLHPDRTGRAGTATFQKVTEAYETLSDPEKRESHDRQLRLAEESPKRARRRGGSSPPQSTTEIWRPMVDRLGTLNVELVLSRNEAFEGGTARVEIPVARTCSACRGTGWGRLTECLACGGLGETAGRTSINVQIPPRVRSGTVFDFWSPDLELRRRNLRVHICVEEF